MSGALEAESGFAKPSDIGLGRYADRLRAYLKNSRSERTKNEYRNDFEDWVRWCREEDVQPLPAQPVAVACYLVSLADRGLAYATMRRRLVSIRVAHQQADHPDPTRTRKVKATLQGIRRDPDVDAEGVNAKAALRTGDIVSMVQAIREALDSPRYLRDQAVLLMGFAGGLRRSELASLKVRNLHFADEGVWVELERSKSDQAGRGEEVSIHTAETPEHCPVRACREWLEAAELAGDDYLFQSIDRWGNVGTGGLSGRSIANIVKEAAADAGLAASKYSGHSLRSGFVTELMASGEGDSSIMQQTRHESAETLRKYDKGAARFRRDFTLALGL